MLSTVILVGVGLQSNVNDAVAIVVVYDRTSVIPISF